MRKLIATTIISCFLISCYSQSFIGPSFGIDYALVRESSTIVGITEDGYSAQSFVYGIRAEHLLTHSFSLAIFLAYTEKNVKANSLSFVSIEGLKFKQYRNSLTGKWYVFRKWYVGVGATINYIPNVHEYGKQGKESMFFFRRTNKKEFGGLISTGFRHQNFLLDVYFNKSFTPESKNKADLKPINSFGISLSYLIQVGKGRK